MRIAPYLTALLVGFSAFGQPASAAPLSHVAIPAATVISEPCPYSFEFEVDGCAFTDTDTVYVGFDPDDTTVQHELGHLFAHQALTDGDRRFFARLLGYGAHVLWESTETTISPVGEAFADAYMACRLGMTPDDPGVYVWQMMSRYDPSMRRHRQICRALQRVSAR